MTERTKTTSLPQVREFAFEAVFPILASVPHVDRAFDGELAPSAAPSIFASGNPNAGRLRRSQPQTRTVDLRDLRHQTRDGSASHLARDEAPERTDDHLDDTDLIVAFDLVCSPGPLEARRAAMPADRLHELETRAERIKRMAKPYREGEDDEAAAIVRMVADLASPDPHECDADEAIEDREDESDDGWRF